MSKNTAGPAFPFEYHNQTREVQDGFFETGPLIPGASQQFAGMTLRDYFAAKALPSVYQEFWNDANEGKFFVDDTWPEGVAGDAYRIADAMIKVRDE